MTRGAVSSGLVRSVLLAFGLLAASSAALTAALLRGGEPVPGPRLMAVVDSAGRGHVFLSNLADQVARRIESQRIGVSQWEGMLKLSVGRNPVAVAAQYRFGEEGLELVTRYPLVPGLEYVASASPRDLYRLAGLETGAELAPISRSLSLPILQPKPSAVVAGIYPTGDSLPENLLKFYVEFSRPMQGGDAAQAIELLDSDGKPVPAAFLGLTTELWDQSHRRLTVYLDPGRIKRGLRPNLEMGSPLKEGKGYRLRIGSMRDADGVPLLRGYEKAFVAAPARRQRLDPDAFKVSLPAAGSRAPLVITLPQSVDFALARRMIRLEGQEGGRLPVTVTLADQERKILLTPAQPWRTSEYTLVIDGRLEDLAGNTFQRPFDADLDDPGLTLHDDLGTMRRTFPVGGATS